MELGFWLVPIVEWDSGLFELYSGFKNQKFTGFRIPNAKVSWNTESAWGERNILAGRGEGSIVTA